MASNVLRDELSRFFDRLRGSIRQHDQGVLLAVILSAIPVLPMPVFGLVLGLANRSFCRTGKLDDSEHGLVKKGLALAVINIVIGLALLALAIHLFSSISFDTMLDYARERVAGVFSFFLQLLRPTRPGVTV